MLKISFTETPTEERWILHGRLNVPWVHELRTCWKKNHRTDVGRTCIVDLNEVTFIDRNGERLLAVLVREGAQCVASGIYDKHIVEHLTVRAKAVLLGGLASFFSAAVLSALTLIMHSATISACVRTLTFSGIWLLARTNSPKPSATSTTSAGHFQNVCKAFVFVARLKSPCLRSFF
jgi:hypothetical protein